MAARGTIVVIGSINMDLVCRVPRIPVPGETILGNDLLNIPGGKGANQAVAAAKLGAAVHMIGRVGGDDFGQRLLSGLDQHGVQTQHVTLTEGVPSGCAMILVDQQGENAIVVAPGANHRLEPADIDAAEDLIASASAVVMQLEVPLATIEHAIEMCRRLGVYTILDPAPAPAGGLPAALYQVDLLTPNQSEAQMLLGLQTPNSADPGRPVEPKQVGGALLKRGARMVVLKMGARGAMALTHDGQIQTIPALPARVQDTTAAGDAFTGALAVALSEGMPLPQAGRFAACAGALCCEAFGAQPALPTREAVEQRLRQG